MQSLAEQQFVIMRISTGSTVSGAEFDWAVEQGYVSVDEDEGVEVTAAGWEFLHG